MKNFKLKTSFLLLAILCIGTSAGAEEMELGKIVVTPSRMEEGYGEVTGNIDIITAEDIELSGAQNVADVLTGLSSVNISNYGGLGASKTIRMRGSTAAQVLVLIDGRPANNPRDGEVDLSTIAVDNIDRIEVMHGPGSTLYGSGAMGGTVNIITKKVPQEYKTEITSSLGTFRTYRERVSHGGRISQLGYIISGDYEGSEGFRDNSEFLKRNLNAKLEYNLNPQNILTLNSGMFKSRLGTPGTITAVDIDDKQENIKNFVDLNWTFKLDSKTKIITKVYQNYDRLEFSENTAGSVFDVAFNKDTHATTVRGIDVQFNKELFDKYQLITGVNYVKNINDSTTSGNHKYNLRAAYMENQIDLTDSLKVDFGGRIDDYSNFGSKFNPRSGLVYKIKPNIKVYGSIAKSFRAPTFNDLYWPDQGWIKGNPNLRPEKGITAEVGAEIEVNKYLSSGLTIYRSEYDDLINWAEADSVWTPTNINSAVIKGAEFENTIHFNQNWDIKLGYTRLLAKDANTDKYLIYQPKSKFDCSLKYNNLNGLILELSGQFTDRRYHDAANTVYEKPFFVVGFNASKQIKEWLTYFIYIDNLLNNEYQVIQDYPVPGFSLTSGVKLEF